ARPRGRRLQQPPHAAERDPRQPAAGRADPAARGAVDRAGLPATGRRDGLMQKSAPSFGRIAAMVLFALSCFGLVLFLWLAFGGPVPLKPKGYCFTTSFPD